MKSSILKLKMDACCYSRPESHRSLYLSDLKSGEYARVRGLTGSEEYRSKILSLGVVPGTELKVLNGSQGCPYVLKINGSRLMLGWEMAKNIKVYAI
ncbi:MAG: FeoA family protein [Bacillota bacterium]